MNRMRVFAPVGFMCLGLLLAVSLAANHSFDLSTGRLAVDYAGYLSKHAIVFNKPITDPVSGMTFGNGRVGAMIWNANGITMQVTGVDASEQTCFSEGWVNLSTTPAMDQGTTVFQQSLSLYDGMVTTRYDANRTVTFFGSPNSEILGIHVEDSRTNVTAINLQISMWDPSTQITTRANPASWTSMHSDVPDLNTWKTINTYADPASAGLSRGQTDVNKFGYTLAASVEGTPFTTRQVDARSVALQITPAKSYTIWLACASRINAPSNNSIAQAKNILAAAASTGYGTTLTSYKSWWHDFWAKSFVHYSNSTGDADYLENYYYLANYQIASGAYGLYPFHFINGVYRSNADVDIHWSGGYWYWNQRAVYNSFLASNHSDAIAGFYRLYSSVLAKLQSFTNSRFGINGAWTPETMRWDGDAIWTTTSPYVENIFSTGAEVASNMYMNFAYTNDSTFLKNTAYPYMREAAKFLAAKLSYNSGSKQYYMSSSNSHENYWNVPNALTDLAAIRCLFPQAIKVAKALNADAALQLQWQNIVDNLAPFKSDGSGFLPCDPPVPGAHNHENVSCEIIWPYSQTGIGKPNYQTGLSTWNSRPNPYRDIWSPDAVQAARLGLGDQTLSGMKQMLEKYQSYPNGMTNTRNGIFEFVGLHLLAMNESLLQSYDDTIRVFPAVPASSTFDGKFTLLAKGGFLVSSEKEASDIKYVGIKSLHGGQLSIVNPWGTQSVQVRNVTVNSTVLTTSAGIVSFATTASGVYVIERTAKTLAAFTYANLTSSPNGSAKSMAVTTKTLVLGDGQGQPVGAKLSTSRPSILPLSIKSGIATNGKFFIHGTGNQNVYSVALYDFSGRCMKSANVTRRMIDLKREFRLPQGAYIVKVKPARGQ